MTRPLPRPFFRSVVAAAAVYTCLTAGLGWAATPYSPPEGLAPTKAQASTTVDIVKKLDLRHYRDLELNDEVSKQFLEKYLTSLDSSRLYFLASDIDTFKQNEKDHDDYLRRGELDPGFAIYKTYRQRVTERLEWVLSRLADTSYQFDFNNDESVEMDRSESPWPANKAEADALWSKRLELHVLNLKLAGKTVEEARDTLKRRFSNQLKRMAQQNSHDVYETLINAFTTLYDPHTNYFSPRTSKNFNINMSLQLEGIGAVLQSEDEHTKVLRLVPGGPADKQGQLKPADKILGVGQGEGGEVVDVVGWRLDEVVDLIRGRKDSLVRLEVVSSDNQPKVVPIRRGTVQLEDQAAQGAVLKVLDGETVRRVGVIDIPAFYHDFEAYRRGDKDFRSTTRDVARLLEELQAQNVEGIILDLRDNGGGSLQEATMLTDLFIDQGPVVQIREADGSISQHNRARKRAIYRGPLVVMINRLSASASEIFAGAIQDYKRGLIVGSQSFGKGTVQLLSELPEGQLKLTESKFYRVSGDSTQHRGVMPDIDMPVLVDKDEVGESAYSNALPWDTISAAPHNKYFDFTRILPEIKTRHENRIANDPDIINLLDKVALVEKAKARTQVSLSEKVRVKEKQEQELEQLAIENKRRAAKGMPLLKTPEEFKALEDKELEKVTTKSTIDVETDALLTETGYIMVDLMDLLTKHEAQQLAKFD